MAEHLEALGLADEVVERCFTGSVTRIGGSNFSDLEATIRTNHAAAWTELLPDTPRLLSGGQLYWRRDGEDHDWDPETLSLLQAAVRTDDASLYQAFSARVDRPAGGPRHLRSLLGFRAGTPVAVETVAEKLAGEIRATHPEHICFSFKVGATPHKAAMRSMEQMIGEVKPRVERALGRLAAE